MGTEHWVEAPLSQLLESLESGSRPKGGVKGIAKGIPSIGAEHLVSDGGFNFENIRYIPEDFANSMNRGQIRYFDILVVKDGATTGKTSFVQETFPFPKACVNEHVFICRAIKVTSKEFLFHYLKSHEGQEYIMSTFHGAAQGGISSGFADVVIVPLPPLPEQKRIVEKLDAILPKVKNAKERLDKIPRILKRFRQIILANAYTGRLTEDWREKHNQYEPINLQLKRILKERQDRWEVITSGKRKCPVPVNIDEKELPSIPDSWKWQSADALCAQITDGEHIQPPYQPKGRPMLTATHVRDGYIEFSNFGLILPDDFEKCLKRCEPKENDLLIVSVGATTGRAAIVGSFPPFAIVRSVLLLKPLVEPKFFLRWLQSPWCFTWMSQASGASAQPHLYISDTKRMPVPFPPLEEQHEIARRVEKLFKLANSLEAKYKKAIASVKKIEQSVLAKAFRGELAPQDPNDEPAEELLKRILAEKAKLEAVKKKSKRFSPR